MNWYLMVLKKYAVFSGRSRRKEYWFFFLFNVIVSIVLAVVDMAILGSEDGAGILSIVYALGVLIPSLAVSIRRLHDIDKSGWWLLIGLIPAIGGLVLLIFACMAGTQGDNRFGPDPVTD